MEEAHQQLADALGFENSLLTWSPLRSGSGMQLTHAKELLLGLWGYFGAGCHCSLALQQLYAWATMAASLGEIVPAAQELSSFKDALASSMAHLDGLEEKALEIAEDAQWAELRVELYRSEEPWWWLRLMGCQAPEDFYIRHGLAPEGKLAGGAAAMVGRTLSGDPGAASKEPSPAEKAARLRAKETAQRRADAETQFKAKGEEEALIRADKDAKLKVEEEARLQSEEHLRLKAEEERRSRLEEEARHKAEEAQEKAKAAAAAAKAAAAASVAATAAAAHAEEQAHLKALLKDEEARIKAEEEARKKADEEARMKAAEEARIIAEEEARIKVEEEDAKMKAEEEARISAEESARIQAEEEARIGAEEYANAARILVADIETRRLAQPVATNKQKDAWEEEEVDDPLAQLLGTEKQKDAEEGNNLLGYAAVVAASAPTLGPSETVDNAIVQDVTLRTEPEARMTTEEALMKSEQVARPHDEQAAEQARLDIAKVEEDARLEAEQERELAALIEESPRLTPSEDLSKAPEEQDLPRNAEDQRQEDQERVDEERRQATQEARKRAELEVARKAELKQARQKAVADDMEQKQVEKRHEEEVHLIECEVARQEALESKHHKDEQKRQTAEEKRIAEEQKRLKACGEDTRQKIDFAVEAATRAAALAAMAAAAVAEVVAADERGGFPQNAQHIDLEVVMLESAAAATDASTALHAAAQAEQDEQRLQDDTDLLIKVERQARLQAEEVTKQRAEDWMTRWLLEDRGPSLAQEMPKLPPAPEPRRWNPEASPEEQELQIQMEAALTAVAGAAESLAAAFAQEAAQLASEDGGNLSV